MSDVNSVLKCKIWSYREKLDSKHFPVLKLVGIIDVSTYLLMWIICRQLLKKYSDANSDANLNFHLHLNLIDLKNLKFY